MMRYAALCLVMLTVACGPSNQSSSDVLSSKSKTTISDDSFTVVDPTLSPEDPSLTADPEIATESDPALEVSKDFPLEADPTLTPGVRCKNPDEMRYPEKIAYCERHVSSGTKRSVISTYDDRLGYNIENMDRGLFKIDHFIPLCMGGDNDKTNLWPQHKSSYERTDGIEQALCLALSRGKITQDESIDQMLYAKSHLTETTALLKEIKKLL